MSRTCIQNTALTQAGDDLIHGSCSLTYFSFEVFADTKFARQLPDIGSCGAN